jgi:hypothetical protein
MLKQFGDSPAQPDTAPILDLNESIAEIESSFKRAQEQADLTLRNFRD